MPRPGPDAGPRPGPADATPRPEGAGGHAERAARTYGAAADHFTLPPLSFWDRFRRGNGGAAAAGTRPLGSGYRATVDALSQEQRDTVRERLLARLRSAGVTTLRTDVVFGAAERPRRA
jgi:hypothetical protein